MNLMHQVSRSVEVMTFETLPEVVLDNILATLSEADRARPAMGSSWLALSAGRCLAVVECLEVRRPGAWLRRLRARPSAAPDEAACKAAETVELLRPERQLVERQLVERYLGRLINLCRLDCSFVATDHLLSQCFGEMSPPGCCSAGGENRGIAAAGAPYSPLLPQLQELVFARSPELTDRGLAALTAAFRPPSGADGNRIHGKESPVKWRAPLNLRSVDLTFCPGVSYCATIELRDAHARALATNQATGFVRAENASGLDYSLEVRRLPPWLVGTFETPFTSGGTSGGSAAREEHTYFADGSFEFSRRPGQGMGYVRSLEAVRTALPPSEEERPGTVSPGARLKSGPTTRQALRALKEQRSTCRARSPGGRGGGEGGGVRSFVEVEDVLQYVDFEPPPHWPDWTRFVYRPGVALRNLGKGPRPLSGPDPSQGPRPSGASSNPEAHTGVAPLPDWGRGGGGARVEAAAAGGEEGGNMVRSVLVSQSLAGLKAPRGALRLSDPSSEIGLGTTRYIDCNGQFLPLFPPPTHHDVASGPSSDSAAEGRKWTADTAISAGAKAMVTRMAVRNPPRRMPPRTLVDAIAAFEDVLRRSPLADPQHQREAEAHLHRSLARSEGGGARTEQRGSEVVTFDEMCELE